MDLFLATIEGDWAWNKDAIGKPCFVPWSRSKSFYLNASICSCLQHGWHSALCRRTCRGLESLRAMIRTAFHTPGQKELLHFHEPGKDWSWGNFSRCSSKWEDHRKSIQLLVAIASLTPKEWITHCYQLTTQVDHCASWRTTFTADWTTKKYLLRRKEKTNKNKQSK